MASFLITRMTYEAQLLPLLLRAVIDPTATFPTNGLTRCSDSSAASFLACL
jgi:hypothetical protein